MALKEKLSTLPTPLVVALGNPLLDICVLGNDNGLLTECHLLADSETELERNELEKVIAKLPSNATKSAGGASQNTVRIIQKLCGKDGGPKLCIFCGGLGNDDRGELLKQLVESSNVDARYAIHPSLPTGVCVSIITDGCRSLAANIGAATTYTIDDLKAANLPLDTLKVIYIEGFFITHSIDVAKEIIKLAQEKNIIVVFNLSGTYIFNEHRAAIVEMVALAKIVFGNAREMIELANSLNLAFDNIMEIPFLLNNLKGGTRNATHHSNSHWLSSNEIFVMTQGGSDPAIVVWGKGESVQVNPVKPSEPIVDTTGAGDALVAGFIAGILGNKDAKTCLQWGCKTASLVITNLGACLPDKISDSFLE